MDAEIYQEMLPKQYIWKYLDNNIRIDKREIGQARQIDLAMNAENSSTYLYAASYIYIQIETSQSQFKTEEFNNGENIECLCKLDYQTDELSYTEKSKLEQYLSKNVVDTLRLQYRVQIRLCMKTAKDATYIKKSLKYDTVDAWKIVINVRVSGNEGSLLSHLINSVQMCLSQVKVLKDEQNLNIVSVDEVVMAYTLAHYHKDAIQIILIDPNRLEEQNSDGTLLVIMNQQNQYVMKKSDGVEQDYQEVCRSIDFLRKYIQEDLKSIKQLF